MHTWLKRNWKLRVSESLYHLRDVPGFTSRPGSSISLRAQVGFKAGTQIFKNGPMPQPTGDASTNSYCFSRFVWSAVDPGRVQCLPRSEPGDGLAAKNARASWLSLGLHTFSILVTMAVLAWIVCTRLGLMALRQGWVNLDLIWSKALFVVGGVALIMVI